MTITFPPLLIVLVAQSPLARKTGEINGTGAAVEVQASSDFTERAGITPGQADARLSRITGAQIGFAVTGISARRSCASRSSTRRVRGIQLGAAEQPRPADLVAAARRSDVAPQDTLTVVAADRVDTAARDEERAALTQVREIATRPRSVAVQVAETGEVTVVTHVGNAETLPG